MVTFRLALLYAALFETISLCCLGGETLTFVPTRGRQYKGVELTRVEKVGIVVTTDSGIEHLPFEVLPEDMRKRFGYDPAAAAAERKRLAQERAVPATKEQQEEFNRAFKEGFKDGFKRSMEHFAEIDLPIKIRKAEFAAEILESTTEPKTEFEKARYQYAIDLQEKWNTPPKLASYEETKRKMQLRDKGLPTEEDIPAHLLSEEAFNEWKKAKANLAAEPARAGGSKAR